MKLRLVAVLIFFGLTPSAFPQATSKSTATESLSPVHVRWIVDLKKSLGYDDFDRASAHGSTWKLQQGIAFLTPDEVAVYQLEQPHSPSSTSGGIQFYFHATILDTRNGHEIKTLQFPLKTEVAKLIPTRGGAFLVYTGDALLAYSAKFEQIARKDLPSGGHATKDDPEIDVSPSGAKVILAGKAIREDSKGKQADGGADVEVLDSQTLESITTFVVPRLGEWSAADNSIVTTDPQQEHSRRYGIMDFSGKWRALKTSAENSDPRCPYRVEALEHQLFVAHDCDDLEVVTASGRERFSHAVRVPEVLVSVAGADRYLAEALVEPQSARASISVYDLRHKAQIAWLSLEKKTIYYSISSAGTVAAVDGEKVKFFEPATSLNVAGEQQRWTVELADQYGFDSFDRDNSQRWMKQQDTRFITPDEIAVYQVKQEEMQLQKSRADSIADQPTYTLQLKIFSARDGHLMKSLSLPTTSGFTKVIPTHDGKFIVRTGDLLSLYTAGFEATKSRLLPLEKIAGVEGWQVEVSPSGARIVLAHQLRFTAKSLVVGGLPTADQDRADIEIVDADTFELLNKFTVRFMRDNWSAGDDFLLTAAFDPAGNSTGLLGFDGKRRELKMPWEPASGLCARQLQALPQQRLVVLGCYFIGVLSAAGERVLQIDLGVLEMSVAAAGAGNYIAVEVDKMRVGRRISDSKPWRIEVYDLRTGSKVISVALTSSNPYFDISSQGELAVVENDQLSLYFPKTN